MRADSKGLAARRRILSCAVATTLACAAGFVLLWAPDGALSTVLAQSPTPTHYVQNAAPTGHAVPSGASGLVVEGLGGGLGGCSYSASEIENATVSSINADQNTFTELTIQSNCDSAIGDWTTLIDSIEQYVESNATSPGTYWGGFMLDEENGYWTASDDVTAFTTVNTYVQTLMSSTPGLSYYFTETFGDAGAWSQSDFNSITDGSRPAPQIASASMVSLTNSWESTYGGDILVTYGPGYPTGYQTEASATSHINGSPYYQTVWNVDLANCFANGGSC